MKFVRGDTYCFKFQRKNENGEVIKEQPDQLYFTVKYDYGTKKIELQKSLKYNGITYSEEENMYHVRIENEDTRNMAYGSYVYDIQVITGDYVKTISKGEFILDKEVTFEYE